MKGNKKAYIFSAIAFLTIISGYLLFEYMIKSRNNSEEIPARELKSVYAVPVDAIAVCIFDNPLAIEDLSLIHI